LLTLDVSNSARLLLSSDTAGATNSSRLLHTGQHHQLIHCIHYNHPTHVYSTGHHQTIAAKVYFLLFCQVISDPSQLMAMEL